MVHSGRDAGIDVIINGRSGAGENAPLADRVSAFLTARGLRHRVEVVGTGADLPAAVARATAGDAGIVVAGGGDGTIATVAAALLDTSKALGLLPLGTFNHFAGSLDVPTELDAALEVLAAGPTRSVGVGEVNGRVFVNNSSLGLYPEAIQRREDAYRHVGRNRIISYLSAALALAERPNFLSLHLVADDVPLARRTPLLFVGANAYQMAGFNMPGAECLETGRFAVHIARPLGVLGLWRLALRALLRGLDGTSELEVLCARELHVSMRRRTHLRVATDGEVAIMRLPLHYRFRIDALKVVVPG